MHFMVTMYITPTIQGWCLQGHCQNAERDGRDQQPDQPEDPGGDAMRVEDCLAFHLQYDCNTIVHIIWR